MTQINNSALHFSSARELRSKFDHREISSVEATKITYKIRYVDITTIDGMNPQELAAVYGLAPKTERFNKRRNQ